MRFDTTNIGLDNKMYSVIGKKVDGTDEAVQVGMVGKIGNMIEDNVYEFLPLVAGDKEVFFIATPEVDADESKVEFNSLKGFKLEAGDVVDAVEYKRHNKFAIEATTNAIEGFPEGAKTGFLYAKAGKRLLQYKATAPVEADGAILVAKIEMVVPATQGVVVKVVTGQFKNMALNYELLRSRVL